MRQYMVEILRISSFFMVFFYRRFLPLDVFIYAFGAENDVSLVATRSHFGSCVIDAIHYRNAATLPQICLSPLSN